MDPVTGVTESRIRSVDITTGEGRQTLRVSLSFNTAGEPEAVIMALGYGGGDSGSPFLRPQWAGAPLAIPAEVVPALRDALARLEGAG